MKIFRNKKRYSIFVFVILIILTVNRTSLALGKIVDYFLNDPDAWNDTKRITHSTPEKIVIEDGLEGLVFKLTDLTEGDEVALIFLETGKAEKMKHEDLCDAEDKLLRGSNRVVSVITKNHGDRKRFHYKFILQRHVKNMPVAVYNNGDAVLESSYDGSVSVEKMSDLSGIKLCIIEIR